MSLSRRRVLQIFGGSVVAAASIGVGIYRGARSRAAEIYRSLVELDDQPPVGALSADTMGVLLALTTRLLPPGVALPRYEDFFRFHAEEVPGYRDVYDGLARALDASVPGGRFRKAPPEAQRQAIAKLARVRDVLNAGDRPGGARIAVFDREWLLYERYVSREILTLFARTDAWTLAGYGPYPGVPRGLDAYREPIEGGGAHE